MFLFNISSLLGLDIVCSVRHQICLRNWFSSLLCTSFSDISTDVFLIEHIGFILFFDVFFTYPDHGFLCISSITIQKDHTKSTIALQSTKVTTTITKATKIRYIPITKSNPQKLQLARSWPSILINGDHLDQNKYQTLYDARYHNKYCCYYQTSCYVPKIKVLQLSSHYIIIRNQLHEVFDEFKGLQAHLFKYIHGIRPSSLRCPLKCNNNIYKIYYNCAHYKKNDHII